MGATRTLQKVAAAAALMLVVAAWLLLAPAGLGGQVTYVVTDGVSMEPHFVDGDLVAVREQDSYDVGDVVAYKSRELGRIVLHRIVDVRDGRYVFKGDNNDWTDTETPTEADLVGEEYFAVSGGGKKLEWLRKPRNASVFAGALALIGLAGTRSRRKRTIPLPQSEGLARLVARHGETMTSAGGAAFVVLVALAVVSFVRPSPQVVTTTIPYEQTGGFSYVAAAPGAEALYGKARATTGQPLYLRLIDTVDVRFDYSMNTRGEAEFVGTGSLVATVGDADGWTHEIVLQEPSRFDGTSTRLAGTLDIRELTRATRRAALISGVDQDFYAVDVRAEVRVIGTVAGRELNETLQAVMPMQLDPLRLKVLPVTAPSEPGDGPADSFHTSAAGEVTIERTIESSNLPVTGGLALLGAIVALGLVAIALAYSGAPVAAGAVSIPARLARRIVTVSSVPEILTERAVSVDDLGALGRMAEAVDKPILHLSEAGTDLFFLESDGLVYVCRPTEQA